MFKASSSQQAKASTASSTVAALDLTVVAALVVGVGITLALFGNPLTFAVGSGLIVTVFSLAMSAAYGKLLG